jgi:hypothetical protein
MACNIGKDWIVGYFEIGALPPPVSSIDPARRSTFHSTQHKKRTVDLKSAACHHSGAGPEIYAIFHQRLFPLRLHQK